MSKCPTIVDEIIRYCFNIRFFGGIIVGWSKEAERFTFVVRGGKKPEEKLSLSPFKLM